ncbi:MAG TPA: hypothetical protein VMY77_02025 [Chitinophagaceae bacterium]|nr:hypothetical protein [Chitinophagaceae bacterium]
MSLQFISWDFFCIAFGLTLLTTFIMGLQSLNFYTLDVVKKKFSIMDLETPATRFELVYLIRGLYKLPRAEALKSIRSLRCQLFTDFLFMPCAYGAIYILCMLVSAKMTSYGVEFFYVLAWLQPVAWLCDIIENIYLLGKIKPHSKPSSKGVHKAYLVMEAFKWGIALVAVISVIAAVCYFWLSGWYHLQTLYYLPIIVIEILVFLIAAKMFLKNKEEEL